MDVLQTETLKSNTHSHVLYVHIRLLLQLYDDLSVEPLELQRETFRSWFTSSDAERPLEGDVPTPVTRRQLNTVETSFCWT